MKDILEYKSIIKSNPLFKGMDDEKLTAALKLLGAELDFGKKGDILHKPYKKHGHFGMLLTGAVQACCDDFDGNRMIMAEVKPGVTFGESLCFLKIPDSPVYIYASEDAEVLWLSLKNIYGGTADALTLDIQKRFTALLAGRALSMNTRVQILSKRTLREKLIFYFSDLAAASGSQTFKVSLNREDMATYIGSNRAALSRELSKMKEEGIIDFKKNTFSLKTKL